jgi:amino acid transporter
MCCYDAPAHMTEEIKNARKEAPRAIVLAVYMGFITGFAWLIALSFCIGDLDSTATTATGVPVIEIIFNSTGSVAGASASVICLVASNSLMAEGSRSLYAFARDQGLPYSDLLSKVSSRSVPVYAVLLTGLVQIAFNSIYFGTVTGFNTIVAIATQGFCKLQTTLGMSQANFVRSFLRHAAARTHHRTLLRQEDETRGPLLARSMGNRAEHHWFLVPGIHVHHRELPQCHTGG